jgi:hypothetical protein
VIGLLLPLGGWSQTPAARDGKPLRVAVATRTAEKISIDGVLDEPAWQAATLTAGFVTKEPEEGLPPSQETEVRILYDQDNLYLGAYCRDLESHGIIVNEIVRDFQTGDQDFFGMILDTFNDRRSGYYLAVTPVGGQRDMQILNEGLVANANWDGVWHSHARRVEDGYVVEIAVPFKTMRFTREPVQVWGLQIMRRIRRFNEVDVFSPSPRRFCAFRAIAYAGELRGLENIEPGRNVQFKPYLRAGISNLSAPVEKTEGDFDGGADLKYGVTPSITFDLTLNTDFSHVEADAQQVNLTRFPLFFQEKREFFLENSSLFQVAALDRSDALPFHSRTIGLESGNPIPIFGGARLMGRAGQYELGMLNMQTRSEGAVPATNFTAVRLRRSLLASSNVGFLFLNRQSRLADDHNRTIGADGTFSTLRTDLRISGALVKTYSPGRSGDDWAGKAVGDYQNSWVRFLSTYAGVQRNFNPEMGFAQRPGQGFRIIHDEFELRPHFEPGTRMGKLVQDITTRMTVEQVLVWSGSAGVQTLGTEEKFIRPELTVLSPDGSTFSGSYTRDFERIARSFTVSGVDNSGEPIAVRVPVADYRSNQTSLSYFTNRSKPLSGNVGYDWGDYYGGSRTTLSLGTRYHLNYRLAADFTYERNNVDLPHASFHTDQLGLRVNYSFTSRLSLSSFIQYNNSDDQITSNIRVRFIHRPLSDIYVVYNDRHDRRGGQMDWNMSVKYTHMISF